MRGVLWRRDFEHELDWPSDETAYWLVEPDWDDRGFYDPIRFEEAMAWDALETQLEGSRVTMKSVFLGVHR